MKPHSAYHKDKNSSNGLAYYCKLCANRKAALFHRRHKGNEEYKKQRKNRALKTRIGITIDEFEAKLKSQNNSCAICFVFLPPEGHKTHTDHCHTTGKIRDLLCTNCNRGLGHFQDSIEILTKAVQYLEKHR
jgi:hypothetical protein